MDKPGGSFWRWGRRDTHRFLPGFRRAGRGGNGLGDHVRRPCRREWGWGRNPDVEGPSFRAATFSSGSGQSRPQYRQYGIWGVPEALPPAPSPWPSQHRQNRALAEPSRPPSHGHRIPEHPLRSPFDPAGTPPPQVSSGARRAPAPGDRSAGWLATRGRGSGATAPSPAPSPARATQDAASEQRPRGCGPRPDPAPGQPRRRRPTGSFRSLRPRHSRVGGGEEGEESEPSFPGRGARHPTPAPPPSPTTHSCARLTLSAPRGRDGGTHRARGRVG